MRVAINAEDSGMTGNKAFIGSRGYKTLYELPAIALSITTVFINEGKNCARVSLKSFAEILLFLFWK